MWSMERPDSLFKFYANIMFFIMIFDGHPQFPNYGGCKLFVCLNLIMIHAPSISQCPTQALLTLQF